MFTNQLSNLCKIIKYEDLQRYTGTAFLHLIQAVITKDPSTGIEFIKDASLIYSYLPNVFFWEKMKQFLLDTFHNYDEQCKLAEKFSCDEEYEAYMKRLIKLLDELDTEYKVSYFSNLTRACLCDNLSLPLYFKLAKFLSNCTQEELDFIKNFYTFAESKNTAMISSLYQYGLFVQKETADDSDGGTTYILSDFGKALKQNALNYTDGLCATERILSYGDVKPLPILEPASANDFIWEKL